MIHRYTTLDTHARWGVTVTPRAVHFHLGGYIHHFLWRRA